MDIQRVVSKKRAVITLYNPFDKEQLSPGLNIIDRKVLKNRTDFPIQLEYTHVHLRRIIHRLERQGQHKVDYELGPNAAALDETLDQITGYLALQGAVDQDLGQTITPPPRTRSPS